MAISDKQRPNSVAEMKLFRLCPFWQPNNHNNNNNNNNSSSSSSSASTHTLTNSNNNNNYNYNYNNNNYGYGFAPKSKTASSLARSFLPARRRLRLDPSGCLYFPYEPGKQVRSAIRLKNTTRSHVAFKFQTTAPKSCYMRPPGAILGPGESLIATVFKFVEQPENNEKPMDQKSRVKFKIMSLKVNGGLEYIPELFDEKKDQVTVERILRVVFLDAQRPCPALEKLKRQLAEAEADLEVHKKPPPPAEIGPKVIREGLVIDEWKERREKYLARQQVEAAEST